jgi:MEMO1 family protein
MRTPFFFIVAIGLAIPLCAEETRPVRKGSGCSWSARQVDQLMGFARTQAPKVPDDLPPLVAGISPHVDYLHGARVYYPLFQRIFAPEVVIIGVTHRPIREKLGQPQDKLILDSYAEWQGPYGKTKVSQLRERIKERLDPRCYLVNNDAHCMEHSIDSLLPFLQRARRDVRITPIMVTAMSFETMDAMSERLAGIVADYMRENGLEPGRDVFFLISADANHYGEDFNNTHFGEGLEAYEKGTAHDRKLAETYLDGAISPGKVKALTAQLWGKDFKSYGNVVWCGHYSIPFGLLTVNHVLQKLSPGRHLAGRVFLYGDSRAAGDWPIEVTGIGATKPDSLGHWVGFLSAGFYVQ